MTEKIKCLECGQEVYPTERHTYNDCLIFKNKYNLNCLKAFRSSLNHFIEEEKPQT